MENLQAINKSYSKQKPLLLKISPDLNQLQLDDIIKLAFEVNLDGIVATNTTVLRNHLSTSKPAVTKMGSGGLSGKPLQKKSTEVLKYLIINSENKIPIIASGGIFTGEDAKEKLDTGAALIQVWTGFIYEGPSIVKKINRSFT